jgi:hypothetical protein
MWTWLEKLLDLISNHGFPIVTATIFLIAILLALRGLWGEYRRLTRRHQELLAETSRLVEFASYESEIARETISLTLKRLGEIHRILNGLIEAVKSLENHHQRDAGAD